MTNSVNLATLKSTAPPSAGGLANYAEEDIVRRSTANSKRTIKILIEQIRQQTKKEKMKNKNSCFR